MTTKYEKRGEIYPRGVLQVCLDVHGTVCGSFDRSQDEQLKDIELLKIVINTWDDSRCSFDFIVKQLVSETLRETQ